MTRVDRRNIQDKVRKMAEGRLYMTPWSGVWIVL